MRETETRVKNTNRHLLSFCARTRAKRHRRTSSTHTTQRRDIFLSRDGSSRAHTRLPSVATDFLTGQPSEAAALHHGHTHKHTSIHAYSTYTYTRAHSLTHSHLRPQLAYSNTAHAHSTLRHYTAPIALVRHVTSPTIVAKLHPTGGDVILNCKHYTGKELIQSAHCKEPTLSTPKRLTTFFFLFQTHPFLSVN